MRQALLRAEGAIAFTFLMACCAYSQTVNIWPDVAPGSENWTQKERIVDNTPIGTVVFNVVPPTLTVYLPERTRATGTGVIIARYAAGAGGLGPRRHTDAEFRPPTRVMG